MESKYNHKYSDNNEITKQQIMSNLEAIGVQKGDNLAVGLSFKSIGYVKGGPETFIDALVEAVGSTGTIMMNTYTEFFYITEIRLGWTNYVFEPDLTKVTTGIVPEMFRRYKNSIRSRHPTTSVAAIGKFAKYITDGHDEHASAYLPYYRLTEINGKYLAIGIGDKLAGFRHQAQHAAGLLEIVPWRRAVNYKDEDGSLKTFILRDRGGCVRRLPEFVSYLREKKLVADGRIGKANAILVPARESSEIMIKLLKSNPEINLCDRTLCFWCRELERRMNLYNKIENPRYFQKIFFAVYLMFLINWLRERDNSIVAKIKLLIKKHILQ